MDHDAQAYLPGGLEPVMIERGREDDLPGIVDILNHTIMNSNATLATQPVSVAERRDWFDRFSATGPYQLLVARRGSQVLGYAASQSNVGGSVWYGNIKAIQELAKNTFDAINNRVAWIAP